MSCAARIDSSWPVEGLEVGVADPARRQFAGARFQHPAQLDQLHGGRRVVLPLRGCPEHGLQGGPAAQRVHEGAAAALHAEDLLGLEGLHRLADRHAAHLMAGAQLQLAGDGCAGRELAGNDAVQQFVGHDADQRFPSQFSPFAVSDAA